MAMKTSVPCLTQYVYSVTAIDGTHCLLLQLSSKMSYQLKILSRSFSINLQHRFLVRKCKTYLTAYGLTHV